MKMKNSAKIYTYINFLNLRLARGRSFKYQYNKLLSCNDDNFCAPVVLEESSFIMERINIFVR